MDDFQVLINNQPLAIVESKEIVKLLQTGIVEKLTLLTVH